MRNSWLPSLLQLFSRLSTTTKDEMQVDDNFDIWTKLAVQVNKKDTTAIGHVLENWERRGSKFVSSLDSLGTLALLEHDLIGQRERKLWDSPSRGRGVVPSLTKDEFDRMSTPSCLYFAECLEWVSDPKILPLDCVKLLLKVGTISPVGIKYMLSEWFSQTGHVFVGNLSAEHFQVLKRKDISSLVANGHCVNFKATALSKLNPSKWHSITPQCIILIPNFKELYLRPKIISQLESNIFSFYNGPLHEELTKSLSPALVSNYGRKVPAKFHICGDLCLELLSENAAASVSLRCLYGYLLSTIPGKFRKLARLWNVLAFPFLRFSENMMKVVAFIDVEDYNYMPDSMIDKIFKSNSGLYQFKAHPDLLKVANKVNLLPHHFKALVDYSGELARDFLQSAKSLPDKVFAHFEAEDYTKLGPGDIWSLIFHPNFDRIIENLSRNAKTHYCANFRLTKDYLKKIRLREHGGLNCYKSLPFPIDSSLRSRAPELERGSSSWKVFLNGDRERYKSISSRALKDLLRMPTFCAAFANVISIEFFQTKMYHLHASIPSKSLVYFAKFITLNIIPNLSDFAFQFFTAKLFFPHLSLKHLKPSQVNHASEGLSIKSPNHIFAHVTPQDLLVLSDKHIKAITKRQFHKYEQRQKSNNPTHISVLVNRAIASKDRKMLYKALEWCSSCVKAAGNGRVKCVRTIESYPDSPEILAWLGQESKERFQQSYGLIIALSQDLTELRSFFLQTSSSTQGATLQVINDPINGFDFADSIAVIKKYPNDFINPKMRISIPNIFDYGGPQRAWIEQLLTNIRNGITKEASKTDFFHRKFSWIIGGEAGGLIGMIFGKAIQIGLSLPFELEETFWALLTDPNPEVINSYYQKSYKEEREEFLKSVLQQDPSLPFDATNIPYIRPDALTFNTLDCKTNIYTPTEDQVLSDDYLEALTRRTIRTRYFSLIEKAIKLQFHLFIHRFLEGLKMTIRTDYFPFIKYSSRLEALFKPLPMSLEYLLDSIRFSEQLDRTMVNSLIPNHKLSMTNIIKSYLRALTPIQLTKFVKVCTGASNLTKKDLLDVVMCEEKKPLMAHGYFWSDHKSKASVDIPIQKVESHIVIAAGKDYLDLFRLAAKIQNEMLNLTTTPVPDPFNYKTWTAHDGQSIASTVSTCKKELKVYPQPAGALIHSLAVLTNFSFTNFVDY